MNTQEIQEQLQDNQELTIKLGERMNSAEKTLSAVMEIKDYSKQLDELKELVTQNIEQNKTAHIKEEIGKLVVATQNLAVIFQEIIQRQETAFKDFPNEMKIKLLHRFEDKTKGFIIGGLILFTLSAILTGICLHLWTDNSKMKGNDTKFRMVRQISPNIAHRADTLYHSDPEGMEKKTKQLEAQQLAVAEAEAVAKQVAEEAVRTKKEAKLLKKNKGSL